MPAVSKKQQKFFGIVRAIQKGEMAPTTPETAKAAADMKKGDVKKFASTKHKGLPEKKKLKEFVQNISNLRESDFTNITTGNKVGQTFLHNPTGATFTTSGGLAGIESIPDTVTLNLGFGEKITVNAPAPSEFALQGFAKPLDMQVKRLRKKKSEEEINQQLDASEKASGAETAKVQVDVDKDLTSKRIKLVSKILGKLGNSRIVKELKTFFDYLNNDLPDKITNEYFSKEHLKSLWSQGYINDKGKFAVNDYIIGSGQKLIYNPNTDTYSVKFNYDFSDNVTEMLNNPGKYDNIIGKIRLMSGGRYGLDALGLPGLLVDAQKAKGFGKGVYGEISISREELLKTNKILIDLNDIMNRESDGFDTGHGYSSPPDWLTSWAKKSQFSGDLRSLWNNKTRTWNLGGKIVDNYGNPIKKPTTKPYEEPKLDPNQKFGMRDLGYGLAMTDLTPETTSPKSKSERIKRVAKTKRQSLSLDEPIVRLSKKKKVNESKLSFKLIQQFREESNPRIPRKKGQPANSKKHSDLYTDENPKGTIHGLGFKNVAKAKASVSKIRNSSRSHAHKIQAAVAMEQRAREMGKTSEAAVYRKYINSMKKKTKRMNEKVEYTANEFEKLKKKIGSKKKHDIPSIEEGWSDKYKKSIDCNNPKGFSQKAHCQGRKKIKEEIQTNRKISFPEMQKRIRDAKEKRRNQRKESEKLYMDTKKKGVKFFDKKGAGRIRDGKKIYE